ncbi:MAG: HNH endonuclease signature motif containing protein [Candidatus Hodarchaeales archaeon]
MSFSDSKIQQVWEKGTVVSGQDSTKWRKDQCGAWIYRSSYGKQTEYGWEIDHIKPKSQGGSDEVSNLRPLQWENNREKAAGRLNCVVTASGQHNVRKK